MKKLTKWTVSGLRSRIQSIFRFEDLCVELATAEQLGRSDVTPWMKLQLAHHTHDEKDV